METLKYLRTILLGHRITVFTDHKNLIFENSTTEILLCQRPMLEECCSEIKYIKEPGNGAADALSRLMLINSCIKEKDTTTGHLSESYCVEKLDSNTLPLTYQTIDKYKRKDKNIVEKLKRANYHTKYFVEAEIHLCLSVKMIKLSC